MNVCNVCMFVWMDVYAYVCVYMYMCVYVCMYICLCMCVCTCVYMYVCMEGSVKNGNKSITNYLALHSQTSIHLDH